MEIRKSHQYSLDVSGNLVVKSVTHRLFVTTPHGENKIMSALYGNIKKYRVCFVMDTKYLANDDLTRDMLYHSVSPVWKWLTIIYEIIAINLTLYDV